MTSIASSFVSPIVNCNEVLGSSSCLLVGNLPGCAEEPIVAEITTTANIATNATGAQLAFSSIIDGNTVVAATASDTVVLREGTILYFGATFQPLQILEEVTLIGAAAAVTVLVKHLGTTTIASTDEARTWGMQLIETVTDLPINLESSEADRKDLKSGIQGSNVKTRIDLNIPVTYFASPLDVAQASILLPAATGTKDIYFVAAKSSGLIAFGKAKVMGLSESGDDQLTTYTTTLAAQSPFGVTQKSSNTAINTATQQTALVSVLRLAGLPATLTP